MSRMTTSALSCLLTARLTALRSSASPPGSAGASKLITWPQAWTPASVRPAQVISTGRRSTRCNASASAPETVRWPGWAAKPRNPPPWYATVALTRTIKAGSSGVGSPAGGSKSVTAGLPPASASADSSWPRAASDQFDPGHGRVVAMAGAELQDARVPTGPVRVARADLLEQLVGHVLVPDERDDLALAVEAALLGL